MNFEYNPSFVRDTKKITSAMRVSLYNIIEELKSAQVLADIPNLKKLKGFKTAYRIKVNAYRLCFYYDNDVITISRFLPRKDVYRFFP